MSLLAVRNGTPNGTPASEHRVPDFYPSVSYFAVRNRTQTAPKPGGCLRPTIGLTFTSATSNTTDNAARISSQGSDIRNTGCPAPFPVQSAVPIPRTLLSFDFVSVPSEPCPCDPRKPQQQNDACEQVYWAAVFCGRSGIHLIEHHLHRTLLIRVVG